MSSLSEEEENYVRLSLLLTGLSPRAVRALFDKEFPSTHLPSILNRKYNTLFSLQKSRVINQAQWNHLFHPLSGVADSKTFDVTLMICLIRNLTSVTLPAAGFDHLPSAGETTPGADLARIKYYRNYLAHLDDNKIDNYNFTKAWDEISDAVGRLGGASMHIECQELKTKILDQSNHEIMLEMKNYMDEVTDFKKEIKVLKSNHDELKSGHEQRTKEIENLKADLETKAKLIKKLEDSVPWNIKEQMTTKLKIWKKDDQMFVETRSASHVLQCIKTNRCVIVTASSGVGKTFTVRHVALQMAASGYDILPVTNPEDIVKYHNPDKKTLYVIDDLCGTYTLNTTYLDKWKTMYEDIKGMLENDGAKIIASCRLQVCQDEQFKLLPLFIACECNHLLQNMSLSFTEKQLIAEQYLKSEASKISKYIDLFDFFPLLCRLYIENKALNLVEFFKNPFSVYKVEIDKLHTEKAYGKYCALALCVTFNNHLNEEWLTNDINQDIKQIIENTCEACRLNRGTSKLVLLDELNSLINTFLKKEQGFYCTLHHKLFDFLSFYFGNTQILQCLIKNADSRIISERFCFEKQNDSDQFLTIVPERYHQIYIQRMFDDWFKGQVVMVFTNINMKSLRFRNILLMYLKTLDVAYQKQLAAKCDAAYTEHSLKKDYYNVRYYSEMDTPLLHCCALGDIKMVEWCCSCDVDVNYCEKKRSLKYLRIEKQRSMYGKSPLYIACMGGFTDIVTMLMANKADINKCTENGESPLYIACMGGFTEIVTKLLENNADINKCTEMGESPLHIACQKGYADIVTMLVGNKADINKCSKYEESPLYIACMGGFTEIVTKLLENNADINKCTEMGESPLHIACQKGYADIVTMLVGNKADINKCSKYEKSPLYIACMGGFTEIVTLLLENNADINKCTQNGESPLLEACYRGYTDLVTKLMENKADINKCSMNGKSPLYVACSKRYTKIVTMLVDNKVNISKSMENGESPLYIACSGGYSNIVNELVDNKTDINKCLQFGETPLYISCKRGFTEIVTKLVDNKANINKCTDYGESPLYIACKGGYADIVTKLVDNQANINKCMKYGKSPLYIACESGFIDIVTKLVDNKADINQCMKYGESPLYVACKGGYTNIVTKLVDNKADINMTTGDGESALHIACDKGYSDIVTKLVDNNADINLCTKYGVSPLYIACERRFTEIVTKLLDNKADINICTKYGISPLYIACKRRYSEIVNKLVDNKADVNKCTDVGESPLHLACERQYTEIVITLVDNKADINSCTKYEVSPLYIACKRGYTDIVNKLVDNKAEVNKCTEGVPPLYIACKGGYLDIVTKLVDNKADINKCTRYGASPLYIACHGGYTDIVNKLVENNAYINKCKKMENHLCI